MKRNLLLLGGLTAILMGAPASAQQPQDEDIIAAAKKAQTPQSVLRMANEIQKQILSLPEYGVFDDLRFQIKDYTVTLRGSASRPILKSSAENVTKKVEGVQKVINEIEVLPLSRVDDDIRARVYASIYFNPILSRYNPNRGTPAWVSPARMAAGITNDPPFGYHPMHIVVKNGNVKLVGIVDNASDQQVAGMQANSVSGVFSVENDIQVAQKPPKENKKSKK
ncbi:MAG: BON domain-containing protein [Acidobacteria bacterium]|nr:BON domain-containing protein [Acidobacteriota bacterium]